VPPSTEGTDKHETRPHHGQSLLSRDREGAVSSPDEQPTGQDPSPLNRARQQADLEPASSLVVDTVAIVATDPASTDACLRSYLAAARAHGHSPRFLIAASANSADQPLRDLIAHLSATEAIAIHFIGLAERQAQILHLTNTGVPEHVARFFLTGALPGMPALPDEGSAWNALLLETAGHTALLADSSSRSEWFPAPNALTSVTLGGEPADLFLNLESDSAVVGPLTAHNGHQTACALVEPFDPFTALPFALGPAINPGEEISNVPFSHDVMERTARGRVSLAIGGLSGDVRDRNLIGRLLSSGLSRQHLLADEASYRSRLLSKHGLRVPRRPHVLAGVDFSATCFVKDAGSPLAPFPPAGDEPVRLWLNWLARFDANLLMRMLPWAVSTQASNDKQGGLGPQFLRPSPPLWSLGDAVSTALRGTAYPLDSREKCAAWLLQLSRRPCGELEAWFVERRASELSQLINRCASTLGRHGSTPNFWARDVNMAMRSLEDAMAHPDLLSFTDVPSGADSIGIVRAYLRAYGELLSHWPAIHAAALL
jgi:hypothetical protein